MDEATRAEILRFLKFWKRNCEGITDLKIVDGVMLTEGCETDRFGGCCSESYPLMDLAEDLERMVAADAIKDQVAS